MSVHPGSRLMSLLLKIAHNSDRDAEVAVFASSSIPTTGILPDGQRLGSAQRAICFYSAASSTEDAIYWTANGGTTWTKLLTLSDLLLPAVTDVTITAGGAATLTQAAHTIRGAGGVADNLDTISGMTATELAFLVTGAEAITYRDASTGGGNISTFRDASIVTATGDIVMAMLVGTVVRVMPVLIQAGLPEGMLKPLTTAELLDFIPADQITNTVLLQAVLDSAFAADTPTRALFAPDFVNERLLDAAVQAVRANMAMDETTPPVAGSGMVAGVGNELLVEAQAAPDLTVRIQTAGRSISHKGVANEVSAVVSLGGFTIPAGAGDQRKDMVVVEAGGTVVRRVGVEGASPSAEPTLTDGDTPLARITLTQGVDTTIAAGNITDVRNRRPIVASKIGTGYPSIYVAGSTATPVGGASVALTRGALNTMTPAAPGAYNVDNFSGLAAGEWADVKINDAASPATLRDNAVGGGNVWTHRAASIVLAAVADRVRVSFDGTRYSVSQPMLQAGSASSTDATNTTATNAAEFRTGQVVYAGPAAEDLISVSADAALAADGARVLTAGVLALTVPDVPRRLALRVTIAVNAVTAGVARIVGKDASYKNATEDVSLITAVSATFRTTKAYSEITSITIVGLVGAGGAGDNLSVGQAVGFGLPAHGSLTASMFSGIVTSVAADVDSVPAREAVAGYDATNGWVAPTSAPDGAKVYFLTYTYNVTPAQNAHNHSHSHTV